MFIKKKCILEELKKNCYTQYTDMFQFDTFKKFKVRYKSIINNIHIKI